MQNASHLRRVAIWNLGLMVLGLSTVGIAASRNLPARVSSIESNELKAGTFGGTNYATNPSSNTNNSCYYCVSIPKPSYGSLACTEAGQLLISGGWTYTMITAGVACGPEIRYWGANCTGGYVSSAANCTSTKTTYVDP
jgi:hypothetical protein